MVHGDVCVCVHKYVRCDRCGAADGFGVNLVVSTAFGITDTCDGSKYARNTKFSLLVCDTHTT